MKKGGHLGWESTRLLNFDIWKKKLQINIVKHTEKKVLLN